MLVSGVCSLEVGSFGAEDDAPGPFSAVGVEEEGACAGTAVSGTAADDDSPALVAGIGADADGEWIEAITARFKLRLSQQGDVPFRDRPRRPCYFEGLIEGVWTSIVTKKAKKER